MKKTVVNIKNILLFVALIVLIIFAISDLVIISTSITQYTWFGIITTILTLYGITKIVEYFENYLQKKEVSAANRYHE